MDGTTAVHDTERIHNYYYVGEEEGPRGTKPVLIKTELSCLSEKKHCTNNRTLLELMKQLTISRQQKCLLSTMALVSALIQLAELALRISNALLFFFSFSPRRSAYPLNEGNLVWSGCRGAEGVHLILCVAIEAIHILGPPEGGQSGREHIPAHQLSFVPATAIIASLQIHNWPKLISRSPMWTPLLSLTGLCLTHGGCGP